MGNGRTSRAGRRSVRWRPLLLLSVPAGFLIAAAVWAEPAPGDPSAASQGQRDRAIGEAVERARAISSQGQRDRAIEEAVERARAISSGPDSGDAAVSSTGRPSRKRCTLSGYAKAFLLATRATGNNPEAAVNPAAAGSGGEDLFSSTGRFRLNLKWRFDDSWKANLQYDHQAQFGSLIGRGDFRLQRQQRHENQFLDLSQTLAEENGLLYEHSLYRAILSFQSERIDLDVGRQQVPWGIGRFIAPTDLFHPFNFTGLELEERPGVDAVSLRLRLPQESRLHFVYTPRGRRLHPQRILARISRDIGGFEASLLGGRHGKNSAIGLDAAGNLGKATARGELLLENAEGEKDFLKSTWNADYNFRNGLYGLLEYSFNGQGKGNPGGYQNARILRGEIQQAARNYLGLELGYDLTPLVRIEGRGLQNLDDGSRAFRLDLQDSLRKDLLLTLSAILFSGNGTEEFADDEDLFLAQLKWFY